MFKKILTFLIFCLLTASIALATTNNKIDSIIYMLLLDDNEVKEEYLSVKVLSNLVNRSNLNTVGNRSSSKASLNQDGSLIVFSSGATNLIQNDTNNQNDIFLLDRTVATNNITRISKNINGSQRTDSSSSPRITPTGSHVLYVTISGVRRSLYIYDLNNDVTEKISVDGVSGAHSGVISNDGNYVAFISEGTSATTGLFVLNRTTNRYTRITSTFSGQPIISGNGQFIFYSDRNGQNHYAYDLNQTIRRTLFNNVNARLTSSNENGQIVAFESVDHLLNDNNDAFDVFVYNRNNSTFEKVSETGFDGYAAEGQLSANGRNVTFVSRFNNGDLNGIYLYDRTLKERRRIDFNENGEPSNAYSTQPHISGDGRHVVFYTEATNLETVNASLNTFHASCEAQFSDPENLDFAPALCNVFRETLGEWVDYPYSWRHTGMDRYAQDLNFGNRGDDEGKTVLSGSSGLVIFSGNTGRLGYGNQIVIKANNEGFAVRYAHLDSLEVKTGELVFPGRVIGTVGQTGLGNDGDCENDPSNPNDGCAHLHLSVYKGLEAADYELLRRGGVDLSITGQEHSVKFTYDCYWSEENTDGCK